MTDQATPRGIIAWFVTNPVAANLLMILVIALGIMAVGSLRKEAFPSIEPNSLTISVSYESGSARQTEEGVTIKIEEALENVTGIDSITSTSTDDSATVTVEKQSDYDLDTLLQDVKTQVDAISTFPADAENPVVEKAEREEHALSLELYGDIGRRGLQQLADELKDDLMARPEINRVDISGDLDSMIVVEIDEGRLQALGLSLSDVEDAINESSSSTSSAVLSNENTYIQLKAAEQAYTAEDFAAIPLVTTAEGTHIRLGDVATVLDTFDDDTAVLSRFAGHESIALEVITTGQDDIMDSVSGAMAVAEEWRSNGRLPQAVQLATWHDRSESISQRLELLVNNAIMGIVLVFVLLALFLNLTVAFWVAAGLPFIFFGTLFFMGDGLLGLSLNEFTTFGFIMALGIVVDDAVVVGESVYTVRSQEGDTRANTVKGTLRVAVPTLFGVFTTVAAFAALSQISGNLGTLYSQFAMIVAVCLILSVIESKLILPAHLNHLNTRRHKGGNPLTRLWRKIQGSADAGMAWINDSLYRPLIEVALRFRYTVVMLFVALFIAVIAMPFTGAVGISFFPAVVGDTVRAELTMQNDVSFGHTHAALSKLEEQAHAVDAALRPDGATTSGIAHLQVLSQANQSGKVTVELAEDAPYSLEDFARAWREAAGLPEGARTLSIQSRRETVDALRVELLANDDTVLNRAGTEFKAYLEGIPAVSGIEDNLEPGQPQLQLELTPQGRALGITTEMLAQQVLTAFRGQVVQRFQRDDDEVEVRVRYPSSDRQTTADVLNANVRTDDGTVIPLSTVATVHYGLARDSITRIDGKQAAYLSADVDKDLQSTTALVAQLRNDLVPQLERQYPGLEIQFGGEAEEQEEATTSMTQMFALAMLVIYMLLAIPLKSYIQPVLIMTAIPFGIVGAILGHWMNDLSLSILSLNGIIALSGVVVNDSLLLTSRFNELRHEHASVHDAISHACRSRLRAVLLTSLTTACGLLPLLAETSFQAQFLIPAAVSLAYGIMFATVITLILIPSLLMIQHDAHRLFQRLRGRASDTATELETA